MKALTLTDDNTFTLVERPRPEIADPSDVLVRIAQTGICGTDRSILVGKFRAEPGVILGHEAVGVVEAAGDAVDTLQPGDRVIVNPTLYCTECAPCLEGAWNFCASKKGTEVGIDRDGAFADFICLPKRFCHRVPDAMTFDRAVGVEPLTCALNNIEAGRLRPGETVVIVGGGPVGAVCAMAARAYGAQVKLVEPDPIRQKLCRTALTPPDGQDSITVHSPGDPDLAESGNVVIDTVGNLLLDCLDYAAVQGRLVVMGYNSHASVAIRPLDLLQRGLQIIGAGDYNSQMFPKAIALAEHLPLENLVTHRFALDDHVAAFEALAPIAGMQYSALKAVLVPGTTE